MPARALKALEGFPQLMKQLMAEDRERLLMGQFFKSVLDRTVTWKSCKQENQPESQDRIENLQELVNAAVEAEEQGDHAGGVSGSRRAGFRLRRLRRARARHADDAAQRQGAGIQPRFSWWGWKKGLFPHKLSLDDDAGIEEERRLCYVGMTRARDRLVLSWARQRRTYGRDF